MSGRTPGPGRIAISASILAADFSRLGEQVAAAEHGGVDAIHVDVMDGRFVPEITIGAVIVEAVRGVTRLPIDVHLMVGDPERQLETFARSGATSITVHVEAATHLPGVIRQLKDLGVQAAAALNPETPAEMVEPVLADLDMVLLMTVNPGYAGQRLMASVLPKIRQVRAWIDERAPAVALQADGGISESTAPQAVAAGANVLVAASAIFRAGGIEAAVRRLREAAQPAPAE